MREIENYFKLVVENDPIQMEDQEKARKGSHVQRCKVENP